MLKYEIASGIVQIFSTRQKVLFALVLYHFVFVNRILHSVLYIEPKLSRGGDGSASCIEQLNG